APQPVDQRARRAHARPRGGRDPGHRGRDRPGTRRRLRRGAARERRGGARGASRRGGDAHGRVRRGGQGGEDRKDRAAVLGYGPGRAAVLAGGRRGGGGDAVSDADQRQRIVVSRGEVYDVAEWAPGDPEWFGYGSEPYRPSNAPYVFAAVAAVVAVL